MRRASIGGFLALLALVSCRDRKQSLAADLAGARTSLVAEQFQSVLDRSDRWIREADNSGDLKLRWRFRLAKAEALMGRRKSLEALGILTGLGAMPTDGEWAADRARWFILQAEACYHLNRNEEISSLLNRASADARIAGASDLSAAIELRRGAIHGDEGRFRDAHNAYDQALALARQAGDARLEARVLSNIGTLLLAESRYDEAIPYLQLSRSVALGVGAAETAARALGNLGLCYFRLGDYDNASVLLDEARTGFARRKNEFEVQIWTGSLGDVYFETRDLQPAAQSYRGALEIARRVESPRWAGRWLTNLASIAIENGDWDSAEKYNDEALALKEQTNDASYRASSKINAARIAAGRGDTLAARSLFDAALRLGAEDPTAVLDAHAGLAEIHKNAGDAHGAELEFRTAIEEIDRRQSKLFKDEYRLSWLDSLISFYRKYVDFLIQQNEPDRALEAAESSRSKVLSGQPIGQPGREDYLKIARQSGAVLLEYWTDPAKSYLWVVTPERIFWHELPSQKELLPLIRNYRAVVAGGRNPLDVAPETGAKLYNALLSAAIRDAPDASRYIVVPDGELYSLNFETLPDGPNSNRFWIEHATIRIAPSLNYLAANAGRSRWRGERSMLLIGNPESSLPQYPKLEFAGKELHEIASATPAAAHTEIEGQAATPEAYLKSAPGRFSFVHFSAHAAVAAKRESALDSSVILSGPPDKCRLTARDVLSVPLNAELVTVSACRSAGGKTYGGEGLVGFAWAFMKAGAGNVIAGLWDVNDRSTLGLMAGLYRRIAAGAPIADALRSSKLDLIHAGGAYAKPFYWAPFELYTARLN